MIKLKTSSRLVRWVYWFNPTVTCREELYNAQGFYAVRTITRKYPEQVSFCRFFWRAVLITPILSPFVLIYLAFAGILGFIGAGIASVNSALTKKFVAMRQRSEPTKFAQTADRLSDQVSNFVYSIQNSAFILGLKGMKKKICPILYIEE
jgi:hypothetical protein